MADVLYKMQFDDYCNQEVTVSVKQAGYAGAETQVSGGATPCIINYLGEDDNKFVHIKASECKLEFLSTSWLQYLSLFLATNKTYYVTVLRGTDAIWYGWINPEYYSQPITNATNYITTITATDGIAELKNVSFPIPSYTDFKVSVIKILAAIFAEIGDINGTGGLGIVSSIDILPGVAARPLEYMYLDWRSFRDNDGVMMTCYDVLNEVLSMLNARVYQWKGYWRVERIDYKSASYNFEYYDKDGVYVSTSASDSVVALTAHVGKGTDIRFINTPANLEVQPAAKSFTIHQDYGRRMNILPFTNWNGKFIPDEWIKLNNNPVALRYWTGSGAFPAVTYEERWDALRINEYWATESGLSTKYLDCDLVTLEDEGANLTLLMSAWATGEVIMKFEYTVGAELPALTYTKLTMDFSGTVYTLDQDDASLDSGDATLKVGTGYNIEIGIAKGQWKTVTHTVRTPPTTDAQTTITAQVRLYQAIHDTTGAEGVMYKDVKLWFEDGIKTRSTDDVWASEEQEREWQRDLVTTIDNDNILEPDTYEVTYGNCYPYHGLGPTWAGPVGIGLLCKKVIFNAAGGVISFFDTSGGYSQELLIDVIIVNDLTVTYRRPLFILKGTIIDTTYTAANYGLCFDSLIKDYDLRYYYCMGAAYDMKACTWQGGWMLMRDESATGGEFSDDFSDDFFI